MADPRIPFAPLERHLLVAFDREIVTDPDVTPTERLGTGHPTTRDLAEALRCWPRSIERWRQRGIPVGEADRLATMLGHHPHAIWGNEWCDAIDSLVEELDDGQLTLDELTEGGVFA